MAVAKPLKLRLFLEGIEVPCIAAQVVVNVNAPAAASVQIVPLDSGMRFKPRTMVHIFFLDEKVNRTSTSDESAVLRDYKVLFTGEVVGFSYIQTAQSRSIVLQCLDHSSYWDASHATAIEYGPHGNAFTHLGSLSGSNTALFDDIVNQEQEMLVRWLQSKPQTPGLQSISGLAGGIIHMMEAMAGIPSHSKGVNDFFTVGELRCRLLAQICAEENDNTSARLLKEKVFAQWLKNGLQNLGPEVTFRDMIKMLFSYIYYESIPNPVAKYDAIKAGDTKQGEGLPIRLSRDPNALAASKKMSYASDQLKKQADEVGDVLQGNCKAQVKPLQESAALLEDIKRRQPKSAATIDKVLVHLRAASAVVERIARSGSVGNGSQALSTTIQHLDAGVTLLSQASDIVARSTAAVTTTATSARLRSQIIRPDCWFSPPPRCNVVFPEQFTQLSYDRIYTQEVTRVMIITYNYLVGYDALLNDRILAPYVGIDTAQLTKNVGVNGYRALMRHELHTGMIPRVERMSNAFALSSAVGNDRVKSKDLRLSWAARIALFHFFKYRFAPRQAQVAGRFNPRLVCGFPAVVIKKPYILDPSSDQVAVEDALTNALDYKAPSQLIGMVHGLAHSVDQNGATTTWSMHHVREHLVIDDEFVGIFAKYDATVARRIKTLLKYDDVASNKALVDLLADVTPQGDPPPASSSTNTKKRTGSIVVTTTKAGIENGQRTVSQSSVSVPKEISETETNASKPFVASGKITGVDRDIFIPSPPGRKTTGKKGRYGKIVGVEVIDADYELLADGRRAFRSVVLHEELDVKIASGNLPVEEIIRPGWMSAKYRNDLIGKEIYQPFFGCGSIVDDAAVAGLDAGVVSTSGSEDVEGDYVDPITPLDEVAATALEKETLKARFSIERAVSWISYVYGLVRNQGLDVDDFITSFTDRSIATLEDLLGSADLEFELAGGKVNVTKGKLGFHTLSVHEKTVEAGALAGLLEDPDGHFPRLHGTGAKSPIPPAYDVRKEKRDRVMDYVIDLQNGPAFRG